MIDDNMFQVLILFNYKAFSFYQIPIEKNHTIASKSDRQ